MDNFHIDVTGEGSDNLRRLIEVAFSINAPGGKAEAYRVYDGAVAMDTGMAPEEEEPRGPALVFYWNPEEDTQALPFKMGPESAARFADEWLASLDYGSQPDHDGSNGRGFRVFVTNHWGHVWGSFYGIIAIAPAWAMYGK